MVSILPSGKDVQFSRVWLSATPWTTAHQASLSITNSQSLPKLMSIELVMPSNHLILCHPLLLLPSNVSQHQGLRMYWLQNLKLLNREVLEDELLSEMDWIELCSVDSNSQWSRSVLEERSWPPWWVIGSLSEIKEVAVTFLVFSVKCETRRWLSSSRGSYSKRNLGL